MTDVLRARAALCAAVTALGGAPFALLGGEPPGPTGAEAPTAGPVFLVQLPPDHPEPISGRLTVYLVDTSSATLSQRTPPAAGPFFSDPQPMYAIDVVAAGAGQHVRMDDSNATCFPCPMRDLPAGRYRVQAVLDMHRASSSWHEEPGNLYSSTGELTLAPGQGVATPIELSRTVPPEPDPSVEGAAYVSLPSPKLSAFLGRPVEHRAGVAWPIDYQEGRPYAAVFEVPGFGGGRAGALSEARRRRSLEPGTPEYELARSTFYICLDPESGNGHHLFADSLVNGPRATALVEEFIPHLTRRFKLIDDPSARIVTGHSSGAWSSLWLTLMHPQAFGAAWASAPDPVDFRAFQRINIYDDANFYQAPPAPGQPPADHASFTRDGEVTMTIRQENLSEEVLGPGNTSGQQWDSWFAVFGPRDERGEPAALFDVRTGAIDHAVAEQYRAHDIADRLRREPDRFAPIFRERIRLVVGSEDSFDLDRAVALLSEDLARLRPQADLEAKPGYVEVLDGFDHGSIIGSQRLKGWPQEMVDHLRRHARTAGAGG